MVAYVQNLGSLAPQTPPASPVTDTQGAAWIYANATSVQSASFTPALGELLVAVCCTGNGAKATGGTTGTVTDTNGGTWTLLAGLAENTYSAAAIYCRDVIAADVSLGVRVTYTSPLVDNAIAVRRMAGAAPAASQNGIHTTQWSTTQSVTLIPSANGSVVVGAYSCDYIEPLNPLTGVTSYGSVSGAASDQLFGFASDSPTVAGTAVKTGSGYYSSPDNCTIAVAEIVPLGAASLALTLAVSSTAHNTVILRGSSSYGATVSAVTDSKGNTWRQDVPGSSSSATMSIWSAYLASALVSGDTITVYWNAKQTVTAMTVDEFSGIAANNPVDVTGDSGKVSGTSATADVGATTVASELWFTAATGSTSGTWTYPTSSGFTALAVPGGSTRYQGAYQIATATAYFSAAWANSQASNIEAAGVAYKAAGATLAVATSSLAGADVSVAYSQTLSASGGTAPYTWSVSAGSLPAGLSLNTSTGVISGTPTTAGTSSPTFQVADANANTATKALPITVHPALAISTSSLAGASTGQTYSATLAASGGDGNYSWSQVSGSLPPGVALNQAGLIAGVPSAAGTFTFGVKVTDGLGASVTKTLSLTVTLVTYQMLPISVVVEILLNGSWTDISAYVYQRDNIVITGGRQDEVSQSQPSQCTMTLNNRDGRFSPGYLSGAYYPYLTRNVQIRVSVAATSASGNFYNGYRFWGKVADWPPLQDLSGRDVYVQITASGPGRVDSQGGGVGSPLTRYYNQLTGAYAPVAYWPCEEDKDATILGAGIDGGTDMTVTAGTPLWKHRHSFNGSAPMAVINQSTWDGLTGSFGSGGNDVFSAAGTYTWVASTTSVDCKVWGAGGGGAGGGSRNGSAGAGGGEFAEESALAVTPGNSYTLVVGNGGNGAGTGTAAPGDDGGKSYFIGDAVTVTAHGGQGGQSGDVGGRGGSGSGNTVHHSGGAGGIRSGSDNGGGGGGGSGGTSAAGNKGANSSGAQGGAGAPAVSGGGKGGDAGDGGGGTGSNGQAGGTPGGGGGGGGQGSHGGQGGQGADGQVQLTYTASSAASWNVVRFLLEVPSHGGNNGKVIVRAYTGGTIATMEVLYQSGGKLQLRGLSASGTVLFDSGGISMSADGQPMIVSAELQQSGTSVAWALRTIIPGNSNYLSSTAGSVASATVGNVSEVMVSPNADITKTSVGHISVQYAYIDLRKVSRAAHGWFSEMGVDRFIRLCDEQALKASPEYAEQADHWGFESGTSLLTGDDATFESSSGTWVGAGNASVAQSAAQAHSGAGSLAVTSQAAGNATAAHCSAANITSQGLACNPGDQIYCTGWVLAGSAARTVAIGADFYDSSGTSLSSVYGSGTADSTTEWTDMLSTVTAPASAAFCRLMCQFESTAAAGEVHYLDDAGLQNLSVADSAQSWAGTNATVAQSYVSTAYWPAEGFASLVMNASGGGAWSAQSPGGTNGQPVNSGDTVSVSIDAYAPSALGAVRAQIIWYSSSGTQISSSSGSSYAPSAGEVFTVTVSVQAPQSAGYFAVAVQDNETSAAGTLLYIDNVRVHPQMGEQTRSAYRDLLKEIEKLDQGILKEDRQAWGLKYRTRIRLLNQSPALTLDYAQADVSQPLAPVVDDLRTANDITVHRHKGSNVRVTLTSGGMSVNEPPNGVGRYRKNFRAIAAVDEQLLALAAHLLTLGTTGDERYPTVTVELLRAAVPQLHLAQIMSAVAAVEIGDFVKIVNLPSWYPNTTAKVIVLGYTENLGPWTWDVTWNTAPETPYEVTALSYRRW